MAKGKYEFAGDYVDTQGIILMGTGGVDRIDNKDITSMVIELNIYESIYNNAVTGTVVITDAVDLISTLPLTGNERLAFKFNTPSGEIDASSETGHPFHIFKLTDKQQVNEGIQSYKLHFCSREMLRSMRTRVSFAANGTLDQIASKIFQDPEGLDSRKRLTVEPTRNSDKYTFPNMHPLDAMTMLSKRALTKHGKGAGYYFYETTQGYYFRSYENMVAVHGRLARQPKEIYDYKVRNTSVGNRMTDNPNSTSGNKRSIFDDLRSVEAYQFINNYDTAFHQLTGTYSSNTIAYDFYTKSFNETKFDYHAHYGDQLHTDSFVEGTSQESNQRFPIIPAPVDYDQKSVGEYDKSRISVVTNTRFVHNEDTGMYGVAVESGGLLEAKRVSQENMILNGTTLRLTVPGQCQLEAGDVIDFDLRSMQKQGLRHQNKDTRDPLYSGRYLIKTLRHRFHEGAYKCIMDCVKDSVFTDLESTSASFPPESNAVEQQGEIVSTEGGASGYGDDDTNRESYRGRS